MHLLYFTQLLLFRRLNRSELAKVEWTGFHLVKIRLAAAEAIRRVGTSSVRALNFEGFLLLLLLLSLDEHLFELLVVLLVSVFARKYGLEALRRATNASIDEGTLIIERWAH